MSFFRVIVELFPVEWSERHASNFLNEARPDHLKLIKILSKTKGIYSFYNSEYEIIYLGKTKNNLWAEMKNAYVRHMPHYSRYYVKYPRGKFSPTTSGKARKISSKTLHVYDAAFFFSAYEVDFDMIDDTEKLLIRMMPNDLLNRRMEGNLSIETYSPSTNETN